MVLMQTFYIYKDRWYLIGLFMFLIFMDGWEWCRSARGNDAAVHVRTHLESSTSVYGLSHGDSCLLILDDYLNTCTFVNYSPTERNIYWKWPLLTPSLKIPYVTIFNIPLYSLLLFIAAIYFFPAICLALQILELYN